MTDYILFVLALFVSLSILYSLAKNDFVLLRKSISLQEVFDKYFIALFITFFFSRIVYVLNSQDFSLFNPILFLHIIKLPGLSLVGVFIGFLVSLSVLFRNKRTWSRIFDIYAFTLVPFAGLHMLTSEFSRNIFFVPYILLVLLIFATLFLFRLHKNYKHKDGSTASILLLIGSVYVFFYQFLPDEPSIALGLSFIQLLIIPLALVGLMYYLYNQYFQFKKR